MPTHVSKTRKLRGHVSAGHGRIGKHRKHPGGRGKAGGLQHLRSHFDKYHPGYFGKVGMRRFHLMKNPLWRPTVNLDRLWTLLPNEARDKYLGKNTEVAPVINVLQSGYGKVLGKGRLPETPVIVQTRYVSRRAEEKIKQAGGVVELIA
ncbi:60S ribosomal protein L28-B [Schizosaccharomyces pombe]|uniref:Large ribosomal subunit protein uL15A n=1 Tax=Schizosaccharomyces pombe (strain 972 / ATCC 24843) TaxID=284812 RepID=RL28A_SCHPO|nr:60S ribosomal protein L28 [Schizosaccharomyces pombe]P36585.3 RecName: Full=Large ribosomal subunit protein uL15A; AltName: Full=60S ribosomal protein L28-A; AltName: Full=L27A; AltName: Full=L29 [Schizosaccharomyces pombe 972h-]8ESQ_a Chain a, 60S ribosomal protein L28-A [Schizosaccharomyces pombe]8ESR_a Chain a, 60S ribosomal protein L28-A [Schizosaccharomyces pombe]8ETC_a Chain a, 60S ribosomal protein L28-A [Schizosaccharomyces pombe]8ETG_a Chain a, 60S ribosomal protein L28-A [Schizosa|eukprot:NP_587907.1 60S ribosomal protein L28 [Schizosaccharomyces pombe]